MRFNDEKEIRDLIERFESCAVSANEWTHGAHLAAALWYVSRFDFETAIEKMRGGIFKLNLAHNTPNTPTRGYHETLTIFWLRLTAQFSRRRDDNESENELFNRFIETHADSSIPLQFYRRETLFSVEARSKFVEPDLRQF